MPFDFGDRGLSATEQAVLDELYVDPVTGVLTSRSPINSDGSTWDISSGSDNLFFINKQTNISMYPMIGGIKDQCDILNQDITGIFQPSARVYSDDVSREYIKNEEAVPFVYASSTMSTFNLTLEENSSIASLMFRPESDIAIGTILHLKIRESSSLGVVLYVQALEIKELVRGDVIYQYCFEHPVESLSGDTIYIEVYTEDNEGVPVYFPISWDTTDVGWFDCIYRTYKNKELAFAETASDKIVTTMNESVTGYNLTNIFGQVLPNPTTVVIDNGKVVTK